MIGRYNLCKICLLIGVLLLAMSASLADIQVQLNGKMMAFSVPPTSVGGRTMVPLRGIFESLGAKVNWDPAAKTIAATRGSTNVFLGIGNTNVQLNGQNIVLDAPALIIDGATMVPLRFVGESFGADVRWMEATQTVIITSQPGYVSDSGPVDQAPVPSPVPAFTRADLDDLLAPIALYPDPLLAQILPATTFPEQLQSAAQLLPLRHGNEIIDQQSWDISVKAVAYYPSILNTLVDKPEWTTAIGQAYVNQPDDVMRAIQRLRHEAREFGYMESNEQQRIYLDGDDIRIVPVNPHFIYIPRYEPTIVFVRPRGEHEAAVISFGGGLTIGVWLNRDVDWHHNQVFYHGWKGEGWIAQSRPNVTINNTTYVNNVYVNRTVTVNRSVTTYNITSYRANVTRSAGKFNLPVSARTLPSRITPPPPGRPYHGHPVSGTQPAITGQPSPSANTGHHSHPAPGAHPAITGQPGKPVTGSHPGHPALGAHPAITGQPGKPGTSTHPGHPASGTHPATTSQPGKPVSAGHHGQQTAGKPGSSAQPSSSGRLDKQGAAKTNTDKAGNAKHDAKHEAKKHDDKNDAKHDGSHDSSGANSTGH